MVETKTKFHKERFSQISEEKREQILNAAIDEFASNGFNGTSINKVAKRAEISIGAMYSYFDSKEDLFLTVVEKLFSILELVLTEIDTQQDAIKIVEDLFYRAHYYAITYAKMNQIYLDFSTHSLSSLSGKVSKRLECITRDVYYSAIERDKAKGLIDVTLNTNVLAFTIDNLLMMYHFSFASEYYKNRMMIFLGMELYNDETTYIKALMKIIEKAMH